MSAGHRIVRLMIHGRVQGVGFRAHVEEEAVRRRLKGWVRNRRNGAVEAVVAGPDEVVESMIEACRNGPPAARVDTIDVHEEDQAALETHAAGDAFSVLPTV